MRSGAELIYRAERTIGFTAADIISARLRFTLVPQAYRLPINPRRVRWFVRMTQKPFQ